MRYFRLIVYVASVGFLAVGVGLETYPSVACFIAAAGTAPLTFMKVKGR